MNERGAAKSRKSPASKPLASKELAAKTAAPKKAAGSGRKPRTATPGKSKAPAKRAVAEGAPPVEAPALLARVAQLESELEKARSRIRELEEGRDQVLNRIDWVIDSLRSLIETEQ